jgi:Mn2+/Fe2+ NRAMP family transporter
LASDLCIVLVQSLLNVALPLLLLPLLLQVSDREYLSMHPSWGQQLQQAQAMAAAGKEDDVLCR